MRYVYHSRISTMKRRTFFEAGLSFASLLLLHKETQGSSPQVSPTEISLATKSRFSTVQLYTDKIEQLFNYYSETIKAFVVERTDSSFTLNFGDSMLSFKQVSDGSSPVYHYAINIPANKFMQAKNWLQKKTKLLIDSQNGKDEVFFGHWNAHAIYFKDPAGNIGELIARHTLANEKEGDFALEDLLCISEVGIPSENPDDAGAKLSSAFGLKQYSNSNMFIGDENGLFVIPPIGRLWIPERMKKQQFTPLKLKLMINSVRSLIPLIRIKSLEKSPDRKSIAHRWFP